MAKSHFSIESYKQTTLASCNVQVEVNSLLSPTLGRNTKVHSKKNFMFLKKMRSEELYLVSLGFSHKQSEISSYDSIFGACSNKVGALIAYNIYSAPFYVTLSLSWTNSWICLLLYMCIDTVYFLAQMWIFFLKYRDASVNILDNRNREINTH